MVKSCPACGRPNGERAARCLYCAEPLPEIPLVGSAPEAVVAAAPETLPVSERHIIILAPQEGAAPEAVEALAQIAALSLYEARLALQTRRYRFLRKISTEEEASLLSRRLLQAGIAHHRLAEAEVESVPVLPVRGLRLEGEHLALELSSGGDSRQAYQDVLLLVRGEIVRERHQERRKATPHGASRALTPGQRLHIFARHLFGAAEIDPEQFDWQVLGEARSASTSMNVNRLAGEILSRAPSARLDEGFAWETAVLSPAQNNADVASMLAEGAKAGGGLVYDNERQFRFYARWRYLVALGGREAPAERLR